MLVCMFSVLVSVQKRCPLRVGGAVLQLCDVLYMRLDKINEPSWKFCIISKEKML